MSTTLTAGSSNKVQTYAMRRYVSSVSALMTTTGSPRHSNSSNPNSATASACSLRAAEPELGQTSAHRRGRPARSGQLERRSLAAILWAESNDMPDELGRAFSQDRGPTDGTALESTGTWWRPGGARRRAVSRPLDLVSSRSTMMATQPIHVVGNAESLPDMQPR